MHPQIDGVPESGRLAIRAAILPFALAADGTLGIFAGGKRIGNGALIQIGASLGVRITRLAGKTGQ